MPTSPYGLSNKSATKSTPTGLMRRSVRRVVKPRTERAPSPSTSEKSTDFVTPAPSPPPEVAVRNYGTPGLRADGAPKRPMNAFILFSNEMRSVLADQNPELCALACREKDG